MLLAAEDIGSDDVAVVIDAKGTSQRRTWKIDGFEFALSGSQEPMKCVGSFAPHSDYIALRIHARCVCSCGVRIIKYGYCSILNNVRACFRWCDGGVSKEPDYETAAATNAIIHEATTGQST